MGRAPFSSAGSARIHIDDFGDLRALRSLADPDFQASPVWHATMAGSSNARAGGTAPVVKSRGRAHWLRLAYPRESNDTPSEKAFCCVAPGVRFSDFAILATGVF